MRLEYLWLKTIRKKNSKFGANLSFSPCLSPMYYCFSLFFYRNLKQNRVGVVGVLCFLTSPNLSFVGGDFTAPSLRLVFSIPSSTWRFHFSIPSCRDFFFVITLLLRSLCYVKPTVQGFVENWDSLGSCLEVFYFHKALVLGLYPTPKNL